jgi:hypothetical protein
MDLLLETLKDFNTIFTTRAIWYTFILDLVTFQELIQSLDTIDHINLYLFSLEYFSWIHKWNVLWNLQFLLYTIKTNTWLDFPSSELLSQQNWVFFGETIRLLRNKSFRLRSNNVNSMRDISQYLFNLCSNVNREFLTDTQLKNI